MSTALKIIIDDFADFNDMHRITRDAHGVYTLVFDRRWVINIEFDPLSNSVCLFASPGSVTGDSPRLPANSQICWYQISEADLPFGGRIGAHPANGMVILDSRSDPSQLDTVRFRQWLLGFVDQLESWSHRITNEHQPDALPFFKSIDDLTAAMAARGGHMKRIA